MSRFHKSFIKNGRYSWFFLLNILLILTMTIGIIASKHQNYKRVSTFLKENYHRFMAGSASNQMITNKLLAFQNVQVMNEDNHMIITCTVNPKLKNYYLFVHKLSIKIKEIDPQYEVHCKNNDGSVTVQIMPVLDKADIDKIIAIVESYCVDS